MLYDIAAKSRGLRLSLYLKDHSWEPRIFRLTKLEIMSNLFLDPAFCRRYMHNLVGAFMLMNCHRPSFNLRMLVAVKYRHFGSNDGLVGWGLGLRA